jgi:hypothetical protein
MLSRSILNTPKDIDSLSDPNFIPDSSSTVYHHDYWHHRVLYHTYGDWMDHSGWWRGNFVRNINQTTTKLGILGAGTGSVAKYIGGN